MTRRERLAKLEAVERAGGVWLYGRRYPAEIGALLLKAPAHLSRNEADTLYRYRYEHDAGYRAARDRGVPIRALELMLEVLARRDFRTSPGYEDMPATVARELLSRDDASQAAKQQAQRYLRDYEA